MSRILVFFFILISFTLNAQQFLEDAVILKLRSDFTFSEPLDHFLEKQLQGVKITRMWQKFPETRTGNVRLSPETTETGVDLHLIYEMKFVGSRTPEDISEQLKKVSGIAYAQPHYLPEYAAIPNDPFLPRNNHYYRAMQVYEGWDISQGSDSILIGVVDSGTDPDHPDLVGNIFHNLNDPPNGIDDDNDGYIDNYTGWDLGEDDNDPQSVLSHHGVHISGVIAATPDNSIGVAGLGYRSLFLPVKIEEDSTGTLIAAYEGIKYAADAGCSIINCSWGGYFTGEFERDIIEYAVNTKKCLVIGAAGNDNDDRLFYPAAFPGVMAVTATDEEDKKVQTSNYHEDVDISAPGRLYYSTWNEGLYQTNTGTSVACAVVSGIAGILRSQFPGMSNAELIDLMKTTSDFIYNDNPEYIGRLGRGRINLYRALNKDYTPEFDSIPWKVYPNPVNSGEGEYFNIYFYLQRAASITIDLYDMKGQAFEILPKTPYEDGIYQYALASRNYSPGIYVLKLTVSGEELFKRVLIY